MNDIRNLFDQAIAISAVAISAARLQQLRDEARKLLIPRCGNCQHWMRNNSCPREAAGDKPSMGWPACEKHTMDGITQRIYHQKMAEIDTIMSKK